MKILRSGLTLLVCLSLLLSLPGGGILQERAQAAGTGPLLKLHRATFDARLPGRAAPTVAWAAVAPGPYRILQLRGPITVADRKALSATGVTLLEYIPDYAYLVRGTPSQIAAAVRLPQTYAHTAFTLADKLAPALLAALARGDTAPFKVRVIAWPGAQSALAQELRALGKNEQFTANADDLLTIARLTPVRWIEPAGQPRLLNDYARDIMGVEPVWQTQGFYGAGQIIGVADSGLDTGNLATLSPDFTGRIVATHVLSEGGHWDDNFGHGTHVAGSIAGAGVQSGANPAQHDYEASFAGVAPEASLVIQAFEAESDGNIVGIPDDYYIIYDQAYADGARIHSDSWGDYSGPVTDTEAAYGGYTYGAQRTDAFIWDHPDMTILFGAGNSGADGTPMPPFGICAGGDGVVDPDSLLTPGTAKNVITVGASESTRSSGGVGTSPWLFINLCFSTEPIATDTVADDPNGMAAFSSRGPTDDGRYKPDLVAPGTNIVSNRSHHPEAGDMWLAHETNEHYVYSGGTSMATPLVAGTGALVRQWLQSLGLSNPTAALLKATLLNTTADMAPGQYGVGATQEIPYSWPNSVAGWGRADLDFINAAAPYYLWMDDHTAGLNTGDTITYTGTLSQPLHVLTNTLPLRVMLVWTDPPASLSAATQLVNDLDLRVIAPDGSVYYGNGDASADRINNVEGVALNTPAPGVYTVTVYGFNVPTDTQPYALAVSGAFITPTAVTSPTAGFTSSSPDVLGEATIFTNTTTGAAPVSYLWNFGDNTTSTLSAPTHTYNNAGTYTVALTATNSGGSDVATGTVVIEVPKPVAGFVSSSPNLLGETTIFTNTSLHATSYFWDFGDGMTSNLENPTHLYTETGTYTVALNATNTAGDDQATGTIVIAPETCIGANAADFFYAPLTPTLETAAPGVQVTFTGTATGTLPISFTWDFGDEETGSGDTINHTYAATGTYVAAMTATNLCGSDTTSTRLTIWPAPGTEHLIYLPLVIRQ
ncbi:MAG: S8 family serine peptidase [Anaerolineae bacterium]|nr:S8 family serine peptidase [Anaerolineae bacterium]